MLKQKILPPHLLQCWKPLYLEGREEIQESRRMRRRRTRSVTTTESAREKWVDIEENIEFPILRPRENNAPQESVAEETQIEGIL